jgi:hypothetical protein
VGSKKATVGESLFWLTIAFAGAGALLAIVSGVWRPKPTSQIRIPLPSENGRRIVKPFWRAEDGAIGKLGYPKGDGRSVWICRIEECWNDMIEAENDAALGGPGSTFELARLMAVGVVREYPVGTRIRVVKAGFTSTKVVILDGEDGRDVGWIQSEEVLPP